MLSLIGELVGQEQMNPTDSIHISTDNLHPC